MTCNLVPIHNFGSFRLCSNITAVAFCNGSLWYDRPAGFREFNNAIGYLIVSSIWHWVSINRYCLFILRGKNNSFAKPFHRLVFYIGNTWINLLYWLIDSIHQWTHIFRDVKYTICGRMSTIFYFCIQVANMPAFESLSHFNQINSFYEGPQNKLFKACLYSIRTSTLGITGKVFLEQVKLSCICVNT